MVREEASVDSEPPDEHVALRKVPVIGGLLPLFVYRPQDLLEAVSDFYCLLCVPVFSDLFLRSLLDHDLGWFTGVLHFLLLLEDFGLDSLGG
jgi:hypothetical protein